MPKEPTVTLTIPLRIAAQINLFEQLKWAGWAPAAGASGKSGTLFVCGCWLHRGEKELEFSTCSEHAAVPGSRQMTGPVVDELQKQISRPLLKKE